MGQRFARLLVVSLLAVVVCLGACAKFSPGWVAQDFIRSVGDGELDRAIEHISVETRASFDDDKMRQILRRFTEDAVEKGGVKSVTVEKETVTGQTARVLLKVTFGDGSTKIEDVDLIEEDGTWRVSPSLIDK
ncbi:MAG: DUF4878 domain-containing protein [Acidobacteriota bacterium]